MRCLRPVASPIIAEYAGHRIGQPEMTIDPAQQHAAIADQIATNEPGLNDPAANLAEVDNFVGTIRHQRLAVVIGVRHLQQRASARGR